MMNTLAIRSLLATLLLVCGVSVQAARLEYVQHVGFGGYSGSSQGMSFSEELFDLSSSGDITLFGANPSFASAPVGGSLSHGYAADAFYSNGNLALSVNHFLDAQTAGGMTVGAHQQDVLTSLAAVTLRVAGDGEAAGSAVRVSFAGVADALYAAAAGVDGYLQMDLSIFRGNTEVASFLWDAGGANAQQSFSFEFLASVNDEFTFSATVASGSSTSGLALAGSSSPYALHAAAGSLSGNFSVTAVPEPESVVLMLAGLGVLFAVRRRTLPQRG